MKNVVALAGGVGGAKLAWGLAQVLDSNELTIIVNTGDDFEHCGLSISPDLDTVCYTLAGWANPVTGWGRSEETWNCLEELKSLGGPYWFNLGDRDLALHLVRTDLLKNGRTLTQATLEICKNMGIKHPVLPMTDDCVPTKVKTKELGVLSFQEYFVKYQCFPTMTGCEFVGIKNAKLSELGRKAIEKADIVFFCPSNPWVSIGPILEIENMKQLLAERTTIAVSPIIGGKTIKGPAAKMYQEMGITPSALAVAKHYQGIIRGFVLDKIDIGQVQQIDQCGIIPFATNTIMSDNQTREQLARECLSFAERIKKV